MFYSFLFVFCAYILSPILLPNRKTPLHPPNKSLKRKKPRLFPSQSPSIILSSAKRSAQKRNMASQKKFVSNKLCLPLPTPKHNSTRTCPFHFLEKGLIFCLLIYRLVQRVRPFYRQNVPSFHHPSKDVLSDRKASFRH